MKKFSFFDLEGNLLFTGNANECAKHFHYNLSYIYRLAKKEIGPMVVECDNSNRHKKEDGRIVYTVYDKYDDVICIGTSDECARVLGLKNTASFYSILNKTKNGKMKKYRFESGKIPE